MRTLDWRAASWLAPLDNVAEHSRLQHEQALEILEQHEQSGRPFALALRTYYIKQLYGEGPDGYADINFENSLWEHLNAMGIGLIAVEDQSSLSLDKVAMGLATPALRLTDTGWIDAVRAMIARAELITSECQFLSPGVGLELKACVDTRRTDRTVLLLSPPPFESLDDREEIAPFPRAIHADEVDWKAPLNHFLFSDLIARLTAIVGLSVDERLALLRGGDLDSKFPISLGNVFMRFEELAHGHQKAGRKTRVAFCYSRLTQIARHGGDDRFTAMYLTQLAQARLVIGDFKGGVDSVLEAENLLKRDEEKSGREDGVLSSAKMRQWKKDIVVSLVKALLAKNQVKETLECLTELLEPVRKWEDSATEALCLSKWAEAEIRDGRSEDALQTISRVIDLARKSGDAFREAFGIHLRGNAYAALNDEQRAAEAYRDALNKLPRPGVYEVDWACFMNLGIIAEKRGKRGSAAKLYAAAEAAAAGLEDSGRRDAALEARKRVEAGRAKPHRARRPPRQSHQR